jgi:ankyrin repeat protein
MWAIKYENMELINRLIEGGANVNATTNEGGTALMWAACSDNVEIARLLIEKGALLDIKDRRGGTSVSWALNDGNWNVLELLLQRGAPFQDELARTVEASIPEAIDTEGLPPARAAEILKEEQFEAGKAAEAVCRLREIWEGIIVRRAQDELIQERQDYLRDRHSKCKPVIRNTRSP